MKFDFNKEKELFLRSFGDKRHKFVYYLGFSIIVVGFFLVVVIFPLVKDLMVENESIKTLDSLNLQVQNRINVINSTYSGYTKSVASNLNDVALALPGSQNTGFVFGNIYQILVNNGVYLDSVSFSNSIPSQLQTVLSGYLSSSFSVNLSLHGSFSGVLQSIATLDSYPQRIFIYNIETSVVSPSGNASNVSLDSSDVSVNINAVVFY
jgi:hypothetical protein